MKAVLQRIDDQHIEAGELGNRLFREAASVAALSDIADAKAERMDVAGVLAFVLSNDGSVGR